MRHTIERLLIESTSASRCLLAIAAVSPFLLAYLATNACALLLPDIRPGLHLAVVGWFQASLLAAQLTLLCIAAWLWPKRHDPTAHTGVECLIALIIGAVYTAVPILAGSFSAGPALALLGVSVVGLLLFPWQTMLLVIGLCGSVLIAYNVLMLAGHAPYAPAITTLAFEHAQPRWWLVFWQGMTMYVGLPSVILIVMMLFASHDAMIRRLHRLSTTDSLTGLANRRYFMDRLEAELARQQRHRRPMSVLLIDADHFKRINDQHGHAKGDEVLAALAQILSGGARTPVDLAARLGGEEFALLLPETTLEEAKIVCLRLQERLHACQFEAKESSFGVTVSMGAVECQGVQADQVLRQVDANLYRAKEGGRNRAEYSVLSPIDATRASP